MSPMDVSAILNNPFMQVALPIMFTILIAAWFSNGAVDKALEGVNKRLDVIVVRLARIETKLDDHAERIERIEERTSPLARRG